MRMTVTGHAAIPYGHYFQWVGEGIGEVVPEHIAHPATQNSADGHIKFQVDDLLFAPSCCPPMTTPPTTLHKNVCNTSSLTGK